VGLGLMTLSAPRAIRGIHDPLGYARETASREGLRIEQVHE
jgi:hypothetical protein